MSNYERTENLYNNYPQRAPQRRHDWVWWLLAAALLLILGGGGYYLYNNYKNQQYNKQLNLGNKYLKKKDYKKAKIAYKKATKIRKRRPEAQERLAQVSLYTLDFPTARDAYWALYGATRNPYYGRCARQVGYGNTNGNLSNGGNIDQYGCTTYISQTKDNSTTDIYRVNQYENQYNASTSTTTDRSTYLNESSAQTLNQNSTTTTNDNSSTLIGTIPSNTPNQPVTSLNAWGTDLYYLNGNQAYKMDTNTGQTTKVADGLNNIDKMMIYDGKMYYQTSPDGNTTTINRCDLDGQNNESFYTGSGDNSDFIIDDGKMFVSENGANHANSKISSVGLDDKAAEELKTEEGKSVDSLFYNSDDGKIYYNCQKQDGQYDDSIYTLNPSDKQSETFSSPGKVSALNDDGQDMYYVSDQKVYQSGFDKGEPQEIGNVPTENKANAVDSLGTSNANLFVTASDQTNPQSPLGNNMKISTAPLEDITDYQPLENPSELNIIDDVVEDDTEVEDETEPNTETDTNADSNTDNSSTDEELYTDDTENYDEDYLDVEDTGDSSDVDSDGSSTDGIIDDQPLRVIQD